MKIAVIDDLQEDIKHFSALARSYGQENKIPITIYEFHSGEQFLISPLITEFDVAVLDIYMAGIDGIKTAKKLLDMAPKCRIIFVTTSPDHALEGFEVGAVHYLIKPIGADQIYTAFGRILQSIHIPDKYIEIKNKGNIIKIMLSDIYYVDYYAHAVQVHTTNEGIKSFTKFSDIEVELLSNSNFIWCYRNIIVNMDKISRMENREIQLKNEVRLPVNKQKAKEIYNAYADYIFNKMGRV